MYYVKIKLKNEFNALSFAYEGDIKRYSAFSAGSAFIKSFYFFTDIFNLFFSQFWIHWQG